MSRREWVGAHPPLAGVVLCGGAGWRMGVDKARLVVDGEPLVVRVASRLAGAADPVRLAPGTLGRLGDLGYPELADERPGSGPLGGIAAALAASPRDLLAVVAVDMPLASPELFRLLATLGEGVDAVLPVSERGPEPLHAVYARAALPVVRAALWAGRLALRDLLTELRVRTVSASEWRAVEPTGTWAVNLNRPDDLAAILGPGPGGAGDPGR